MPLTDLGFLEPGSTWPPPSERARLERYTLNRWLWEGRHEHVFKEAWRRLWREDERQTIEIVINFPRRLSTLWADLLLGEPPDMQAAANQENQQQEDGEQPPEQEALERIREDNQLDNVAYEVAIDVSRYGMGVFNTRYDERGIVEAIPPSVWFPVVQEDNIKEYDAHVIGWVFERHDGTQNRPFLRLRIHERGRVTHRLHILRKRPDKGEGVYQIGPEAEEERVDDTGVDDFLITPVPAMQTSDEIHGPDDYSDIDSIISELSVRVAQISKILDKHADPNMFGDEAALEVDPQTGRASFRSGRFFPVSDSGKEPGYVTWDADLEAAFKQIETLTEQLYLVSETSPAAFGQQKQGLAESGSALLRLMMAPLAKVNRIRMRFDPALKRVLKVASALEAARGRQGAVALDGVSISWKDGLPDDETEQTDNATKRVESGTLSRESAIRRLDGIEGEQLEEELARINDDMAMDVPEVTQTPGGNGNGIEFGETDEGEAG